MYSPVMTLMVNVSAFCGVLELTVVKNLNRESWFDSSGVFSISFGPLMNHLWIAEEERSWCGCQRKVESFQESFYEVLVAYLNDGEGLTRYDERRTWRYWIVGNRKIGN